MKRDLLTLLRHGIVVTTVLVVDGTIKIVIDIAQRNGFMKDDVAKLCSEITSYFMVFAILVFAVSCALILAINGYKAVRGEIRSPEPLSQPLAGDDEEIWKGTRDGGRRATASEPLAEDGEEI